MFDYRNHIFFAPNDGDGDTIEEPIVDGPHPLTPVGEDNEPGEGTETDPSAEEIEPTPPAVEELKPKTRREKFLANIADAIRSIKKADIDENGNSGGNSSGNEGATGGGVFKVTFTWNANENAHEADKTVSEIIEAYEAGKLIYAEMSFPEDEVVVVGVLESLRYSADLILCEFKFGNYGDHPNSVGNANCYSFKLRKLLTPDGSSGNDNSGNNGK